MITRVLVDLNVVLDVLLDREPHSDAAAALWAAVESDEAEGVVAAHCITTLHYLATRSGGRPFAHKCVSGVLSVFAVAPVDGSVLQQAIAMGWGDFEDAVCAAAATAAGCQAIVTRDATGFKAAALPTLTPLEAVAAIRTPHPS